MIAPGAYGDAELAELYDLVYEDYDDDLALYEQFAKHSNGPSLELAVGSGRVALHLARNAHAVVGIDASRHMLDRLERALDASTRPLIRTVEADMRNFDLGQQFGLVYCALDSFEQMLTNDDAIAALRSVERHLAQGGVFVAQLRTIASVDWAIHEAAPLLHEWTRSTDDGTVSKFVSMRASPAAQTTTSTVIFDRADASGAVRRRSLEVTLRVSGRLEFELLLHAAGLRLSRIYGDTDLSPFTDASDSMVVVAGREGG